MSAMYDVGGNRRFDPDQMDALAEAFRAISADAAIDCAGEAKDHWRDCVARVVFYYASEGHWGDDLIERATEAVLMLQSIDALKH